MRILSEAQKLRLLAIDADLKRLWAVMEDISAEANARLEPLRQEETRLINEKLEIEQPEPMHA